MSNVDLKVVLLGHKNVGKTSIFNRFVYQEFGVTSMTIGAYFAMKQCRIRDRSYSLAVWDTAGEEKFDSLTNFYCRNARAALVCYDITNAETFRNVQRWVDKITVEAGPNCVMMLVGNKLDIAEEDPTRRQVSLADARKYAKSINTEVVEASAKSGVNVNDIFNRLVLKCVQRGSAPGGAPGTPGGATPGTIDLRRNPSNRNAGGAAADGAAAPPEKKCCS